MRSREKSVPGRGDSVFKSPASGTGWQMGGRERMFGQAGMQRGRQSLGPEEAEEEGRGWTTPGS